MACPLRGGYTTGCCAAAGAKAATMTLYGMPVSDRVDLALPDGSRIELPVVSTSHSADSCSAVIQKDAGDDPDITHGSYIVVTVARSGGQSIRFTAGEGVGTVTLPGLSVLPGEPAINPGPRRMIEQAVHEVTSDGLMITISIPGGKDLAEKTFNPRLGIINGLSILGTTGRVRPFSHQAVQETIRCSFAVALASGIVRPVFVPGHIGAKAAKQHLNLDQHQVVEVSNEWGYVLKMAVTSRLCSLLLLGHPGKLVKLAMGQWDTHSSRSEPALPIVRQLCKEISITSTTDTPTVEGLFMALEQNQRTLLADALSERIASKVVTVFKPAFPVAAALINNNGDWLGSSGDLSDWIFKPDA